jgi:hypothetical protein
MFDLDDLTMLDEALQLKAAAAKSRDKTARQMKANVKRASDALAASRALLKKRDTA